MLLYLILMAGAVGTLVLLLKLLSGPSPARALKRRMELVKERHAEGVTAAAQAQIRKLMASRSSRFEGLASSIIPRPALLRKRLEMTGKNITLGKYAAFSLGLARVREIARRVFRGHLIGDRFAECFRFGPIGAALDRHDDMHAFTA